MLFSFSPGNDLWKHEMNSYTMLALPLNLFDELEAFVIRL